MDCNELLADVVARLHAEIVDQGAEVEVEKLPCVWADWVQLGRVFQNLVSDAMSALPPGRASRVRVAAVRLPWQWKLLVVDNGVGVPREDRSRIFEPFQRGETNGRRGTGLGLAICKAIVERTRAGSGSRPARPREASSASSCPSPPTGTEGWPHAATHRRRRVDGPPG